MDVKTSTHLLTYLHTNDIGLTATKTRNPNTRIQIPARIRNYSTTLMARAPSLYSPTLGIPALVLAP